MSDKIVKQVKWYALQLELLQWAGVVTPQRVKEDADHAMGWATEELAKNEKGDE